MDRKTILYEKHVAAGGRMVSFAGWMLPVQYESGVIAEHMAVRTKCGLFDVSHMGEIMCSGVHALEAVNWVLTNDFSDMHTGRVRYSLMCNESGGIIDDLVVVKMDDQRFFIVVNAANKDKDFAWMKSHEIPGAVFTDISDSYAQLALQGPCAAEILSHLAGNDSIPGKYYTAVEQGSVAGISCIVSRTGYTGEDGFELYVAPEHAGALWDQLLETGKAYGIMPCGLGARDTLRLEAAMPLYGHEMDEQVTPFEAGVSFGVKMEKNDFIGLAALLGREKPAVVRIGLVADGRGIIRDHEQVFAGGVPVGMTTSGTFAPYLQQSVAMARVDQTIISQGDSIEVAVRGRRIPAHRVSLPFYRRKGN